MRAIFFIRYAQIRDAFLPNDDNAIPNKGNSYPHFPLHVDTS